MKITNIETIYIKEKKIEKRTDGSQDALLVKISTDSGIVGWGEVDSSPTVADAIIHAPYSHKLVDGLKNIIVGENPLNIKTKWLPTEFYCSMTCIHCNFYSCFYA